MLHLQARVDFEERDGVALNQVLDGARAVVAGLAADGLGRAVDAAALVVGQERRGGLLDELLEAALERAVAGARDDYVAVLVGDDLGLDVARLVEVLLDEALAATEGRDGLAGGRLEQLGDLFDGLGDLHAAAAAAECRLDRNRDAVLLCEGDHLGRVGDRILRTRGHRGLGAFGDVTRGHLVSEITNGLGRRADPGDARIDDGLCEIGVLREEAVAGVDGVCARLRRGVEDLVEHQVRLGGRLAAECERLIGELNEQRVRVGLRVHRDAGDACVLGCADHADRDLAAVGDQNLLDGRLCDRHWLSCGRARLRAVVVSVRVARGIAPRVALCTVSAGCRTP